MFLLAACIRRWLLDEMDLLSLPWPAQRALFGQSRAPRLEPPRRCSRFDALPKDLVLSVLRQLSARPRSSRWLAHVPARDALAVLRAGGPLAAALSAEVCRLGLVVSASASCRRPRSSPDGALIVNADDARARQTLRAIAAEVGPQLQRLVFTDGLRGASALPSNLPALHALHLSSVPCDALLAPLLERCGGALRALEIDAEALSPANIDAIAARGVGLTKLGLECKTVDASLTPVWEAAGPTLQHLAFHIPQFPPSVPLRLHEIPDLCKAVTVIELSGTRKCHTEVAQMLCLFGAQLNDIRFTDVNDFFPVHELESIVGNCANARMHYIATHEGSANPRALRAVGAKLRTLHICASLVDALQEVPLCNLEELHIHPMRNNSPTFLPHFPAVPMPLLRELRLDDVFLSMGNLGALMPQVSAIEVLHCAFARYEADTFFDFAERNRQLKRVTIKHGYVPKATELPHVVNQTCAMVDDFSQCKALQELIIEHRLLKDRSCEIAEACKAIRGRDTDIFIGGVQY